MLLVVCFLFFVVRFYARSAKKRTTDVMIEYQSDHRGQSGA
jgi:hypothetical protein